MFPPLPSDRLGLLDQRLGLMSFMGYRAYMDTAILGRLAEIDAALAAVTD